MTILDGVHVHVDRHTNRNIMKCRDIDVYDHCTLNKGLLKVHAMLSGK
jgi:hypothetical protein